MNILEFDEYGLCNECQDNTDLFVSIDFHKNEESIPLQQQTVFNSISDETQVFESIMDQCKSIAENLNVHILVAFMILETQRWNLHLVYENYFQFQDTILKGIGLDKDSVLLDPSIRQHEPSSELMTCDICFEDYPADQFWGLPCGHYFCINCWRQNISSKIEEGKHQMKCLDYSCSRTLPPNSIKMICGDKIYNNLMHFIMDSQVSLADTLTNCPKPACGKPVNALQIHTCNVLKCSCGHEFCSTCHEDSHSPATCAERDFWNSVTGEDVMKQRLFGENVKTCPNCHSIIEKNGGCNHMTCQKCRHEFCWKCMKDWKTHPQDFYNCAEYRQEDDPFLKKPDNIDREFLGTYNDTFLKYQMDNKLLLSKIPKLKSSISKKLGLGFGNSEFINDTVSKLLDLIYWTYENIRWTQVHLFYNRYSIVKDLPAQEQRNTKTHPNTSEYKMIEFSLNNTIAAVTEAEKNIDLFANGNTKKLKITDFLAYIKRISALRETLLRHCDSAYK